MDRSHKWFTENNIQKALWYEKVLDFTHKYRLKLL